MPDFGGGGGGDYIAPAAAPPPDEHKPFLDFHHGAGGFFSSLVHGDERVLSDLASLPAKTAMGLPHLVGSAWHEGYQTVAPIPGRFIHPSRMLSNNAIDVTPYLPGAADDPNHPLTQGLTRGAYDTASDIEQVPRAGLNTVGQIPRLVGLDGYEPGGAGVGELGTGPGLLGKTDLGKAAARGGGGVAPRLLNDLANISIVTGPLSEALGAGAEAAGAEAAARGTTLTDLTATADAAHKVAAQGVTDAEKAYQQAQLGVEPARAAAASGDPTAAAHYATARQQADAAAESLRQAREYQASTMAQHEPGITAAQAAADEAQAHADRLADIAKVGKTVHHLGSTAANSPFAALHGFGLGSKLVDTGPGQALFGPESKIGKYVSTVSEHAREQGLYKHIQREGENTFMGEAAHMRRGGEETAAETGTAPEPAKRSLLHPLGGGRHANGMVPDLDAQAVAMMAQTGEFQLLRHYAVEEPLPGGDAELASRFLKSTERQDGTPQYTLEQVKLAIDAAREDTPRGVELAKQIPATRAAYGKEGGLEEQQAVNYRGLRGEQEPVMGGPTGDGAFAQVEHNLDSNEPNVEHLRKYQKAAAKYEADKAKHGRLAERAAKDLERAAEKIEGLHLRPDELGNARALIKRVLGPATEVAREALTGDRIHELAAEGVESKVRRIARRVLDGKLNVDVAARDLASEIVKYGGRTTSSLSDPVRALLDDATRRGMGDLPRGLPNLATAVQPAELLGGARERLRAGTAEYDRAVRELARGGDTFGRAQAKLREPNRPPSSRQLAASKRLVDAAGTLRDLQAKIAKQPELEQAAAQDATLAEAKAAITEIRNAAKDWHREQAKAIDDELAEAGVKGVNPTPPNKPQPGYAKNRGGNARAGQRIIKNVPDWSNGGWDFADHVFREMDPAFKAWGVKNGYFKLGEGSGLSPEEAVEQWGPTAHGKTEDPASTMEEWLSKVQDAYEHTKSARTAAAKGAGSDDAIDAALERTGWSAGGDDPMIAELAAAVGNGTLAEATPRVMELLTRMGQRSAAEAEPAARLQPGGDVHTALAADRQAEEERGIHAGPARAGAVTGDEEGTPVANAAPAPPPQPGPITAARDALDANGQALYDRQVTEDQARVQGEHVVPQREAQLQAAPSPGRNQGRREGALLGKANEQIAEGERAATRGDTAAQQGRAVVANAPELTQETAGKIAGPIGQIYSKAGSAQRDFDVAARAYTKQTRALERLDEKFLQKREDLLQTVAAQPRPWRPVAELAQKFTEQLGAAADAADRDYGEGAGDAYRVAAADAANTVALLKKAGFDPQFLIGLRNGETPEVFMPTVSSKLAGRPGQLPIARKTGQRAPGFGLAHATTYKDVTEQAIKRLHQIVRNATAQAIMDNLGGSLHDMLVARGMDTEALQKMNQKELVAAMHDAHLSAWNASDWRGRLLPEKQIDLSSPVIPSHIWKSYTPLQRETTNQFLKAYDTALRHWKAADLYLTGRWHTSLLLGHAVMSMVGTGTNPVEYFRNVQIATRLERLRLGLGTVEDRRFVESHANPAQLQALQIAKGYTPGAVVDRGYSQTEFGGGERQLQNEGFMARHAPGDLHPIQAGWRFQSHIDNVNRTATWLGLLTKGLDKGGLADFRKQFPELAHLTDAEIKNEAAIRLSIRTIGDYKNLSAFEQNVVKRIIPFYPWMRHVTKLALNLAIHNPVRVAWMLHLGLMFSPQSSGVDWLDSSYDRGQNRWYTPPRWNPFDSLAHVSDSESPLGAVSPLINLPVEIATGYNLQRGGPMSRPWTQDGGLTAKQAAYAAGSTVPLFGALRQGVPALFGHEPIARYATGDPVIAGHQLVGPDEQQIPFLNTKIPQAAAPFAPLLGLGNQEVVDAPSIVAAQQRKQLASRKARAAWEKELRAAQAAR